MMTLALDLGLVFVALLSVLSGWRNGFLETLFSIGAWIGGILIAFHATAPLLVFLPVWADSIPAVELILGVVVFLVAFVVIRLIGHAAGGGGQRAIDPGDRAFGGLLGIARGLFLAALVASLLVALLPRDSRVLSGSRAIPLLAPLGEVIARVAPPWLRDEISSGWEEHGRHRRAGASRSVSAEVWVTTEDRADVPAESWSG
jgi:membrane protein required for colicin V production